MIHAMLNKVSHEAKAVFELKADSGEAMGKAWFDLWNAETQIPRLNLLRKFVIKWNVPIYCSLFGEELALRPRSLPDDRILFKRTDMFPWDVECNGVAVGVLRGSTAAELKRFSPDDFFSLQYGPKRYDAYRVGHGEDGIWIVVYENDGVNPERQVAQIDLPITVDNWLDEYGLHALDRECLMIASFFTLAYHYKKEEHFQMKMIPGPKNHQKHYVKTISAEVEARYNPSFVRGE